MTERTYLRVPDTNVIYLYVRYASGNCARKMVFADNAPYQGTYEAISAAEYREGIKTFVKVG